MKHLSRIAGIVLTLVLMLSLIPAGSVWAEPAADAEITVTFSNAGSVVIPAKPVTVKDNDGDGKLTVNEAMYAMHEAYYQGGAAAGYATSTGDYGEFAQMIWGNDSGDFGYFNNGASCWSLADEVKAGDYLAVFIYKDTTGYSDSFARFTESSISGTDSISLTLENGSNWNMEFGPLAQAALTVFDESYAPVDASVYKITDNKDGSYSIAFKKAGNYIIQADNAEPFIVPALAKADVKLSPPVTVSVDMTAQLTGAYLFAPQTGVEVSSDLAEKYGFTDALFGQVSVLDVLVKAHEICYGSDFTAATAANYLAISQYGSPSMQFGIDSSDYFGGFYYNRAMANDGTKYDENNYNGTTVTTQAVKDGDLIEFFFYEDEYYGDTYNWFVDADGNYSRSFKARTDKPLTLTLKGFFAMSSSIFKDADEMVASDTPSEQADVQIYLLNKTTGALTAIEDAITDEDGAVTLSFPEAGTYTICAYGTDDCMFLQLLSMTEITSADPVPVKASVDFTAQLSGAYLFAPQTGVEVSSDLAESYGFTDSVDIESAPSVLDVLVKAHEICYGSSFTKAAAANYLVIGQYGSPNMQFAVDSSDYFGGFYYNRAMANDGTKYDEDNYNGTTVTTQPVKDGDLIEFFFYEDEYYGDSYNWFTDADGNYSRSFTVNENEDLQLTLKSFFAMSSSIFKDAEEMVSSDKPEAQADIQLAFVDLQTGAITDIDGAITDEDGLVTLNFEDPGTYVICAHSTDDSMWTQLLSMTTIEVADVPPAEDADITVTISAAGAVKVALRDVTVKDLNSDGKLNIDEALYAAHEAYYSGGASAGYASAKTAWGLSVAMLWGDDSGNFGYYNNGEMCMGAADPVVAGDYLAAYIYKDASTWSDTFSKFDTLAYTGEDKVTVNLLGGAWDENWNPVFAPFAGAAITVYDENYAAIDASQYTVTDNGDGSYTIVFTESGDYIIQADCADPFIVPALAKAEIGLKATDKNGNTILVTLTEDENPPVTLTEEAAAKIINSIAEANATATTADDIQTPPTVDDDDIAETVASELSVVRQFDLTAPPTGASFPLTITFDVPEAEDGQTVYIYHYNGTTWELVGTGTGKSVTATFNSLSPVAIVLLAMPPQTGDVSSTMPWIMLGAASIVTAAVTVLYSRRRREE